jgi:ATP-dependent Clp protease ATP-binding subunit ClpA
MLRMHLVMATPDDSLHDIFLPSGQLRLELLTPAAIEALQEGVRLAQQTHWDSVRSPHVFMGLLSRPDRSVCLWGQRLQADLPCLLDQFQELFYRDDGTEDSFLSLNREFLSDNVIRLLREAYLRAQESGRSRITPMDLLISLFTASRSIVAECFEKSIGVNAAKLTELAVIAEHAGRNHQEDVET